MEQQEQWKKIVINGKETYYSVSNFGNIRNDKKNRLLQGNISNNGYRMVHLHSGGIDKVCSIHRLVMKAFEPVEDMDTLQINHIDGNKQNNKIENLEWSTALENMRHSFEMGLQKNPHERCYVYDLEGNYLRDYYNASEAAKDLSFSITTIRKCMKEELRKCGDYQFKKYKKDKIPPWHHVCSKEVWLYKENGEFIKKFSSQKECAEALGYASKKIGMVLNHGEKIKGYIISRCPL